MDPIAEKGVLEAFGDQKSCTTSTRCLREVAASAEGDERMNMFSMMTECASLSCRVRFFNPKQAHVAAWDLHSKIDDRDR